MQKYKIGFKKPLQNALLLLLLILVALAMRAWDKKRFPNQVKADNGITVSVIIPPPYTPPVNPPPPESPGGGGGGLPPYSPAPITAAIFQGLAQPGAIVTLEKNGAIAATFLADAAASFHKTLTGLLPAKYDFGIFSTDRNGTDSAKLNFSIEIQTGTQTTISDVFIPPTITASETLIAPSESLYLYGQTVPNSLVKIEIDSTGISKTAAANTNGEWNYWLDTTNLPPGIYNVKAKAFAPSGKSSEFGQLLAFEIAANKKICGIADFNCDSRVGLIDFSILLYWWKRPDIYLRPQVDLSGDGTVNLVDFSIMLYYWTK